MTKYTDDFESFWKKWPGRYDAVNQITEKVGKHKAFIIWRSMSEEDKGVVLKVVGEVKYSGRKYLPDAWKWLAEKRYEDFV